MFIMQMLRMQELKAKPAANTRQFSAFLWLSF
jgi:hypothetical protein